MKLLSAFLISALSLCFFIVLPARAQLFNEVCQGYQPGDTNYPSVCAEKDKEQTPQNNSIYGPNGIVTRIVRILARVIGVAAVIVIIVGGIRYVTSSGDTNNINGAKNAILYAIIGLVIALFAEAIIIFVINNI